LSVAINDWYLHHDSDNVDEAEIDEIKALISKYKYNQLRLPLHAAVMISPIYLLAPIQLFSIKWDRQAMFLVSASIRSIPSLLMIPRVPRPWATTSPHS
jgi:hypothetical protein